MMNGEWWMTNKHIGPRFIPSHERQTVCFVEDFPTYLIVKLKFWQVKKLRQKTQNKNTNKNKTKFHKCPTTHSFIMKLLWINFFAVLTLFFMVSQTTHAQLASAPWPCDGHDLRNTRLSKYSGPAASNTTLWKFKTDSNFDCSPAISSNGILYIGSTGFTLYALNITTGVQIWTYTTRGPIYSSPAIGANGYVYFGSYDTNFYAVDALTGVLVWKANTTGFIEGSATIGTNGLVYVGSNDFNLYAFDQTTGILKWRFLTGGQIHSTPAISSRGIVYFCSMDKSVYALNGTTGTLIWSKAFDDWPPPLLRSVQMVSFMWVPVAPCMLWTASMVIWFGDLKRQLSSLFLLP